MIFMRCLKIKVLCCLEQGWMKRRWPIKTSTLSWLHKKILLMSWQNFRPRLSAWQMMGAEKTNGKKKRLRLMSEPLSYLISFDYLAVATSL